jgi:uncharacterized coiled-coil protein SlyX
MEYMDLGKFVLTVVSVAVAALMGFNMLVLNPIRSRLDKIESKADDQARAISLLQVELGKLSITIQNLTDAVHNLSAKLEKR